ncbi:MAG TPA: histidine kinase dimerization/phospho-acceptor domain-containing protein, partial [Rhizomicrobium sp.]
MFASLPSSATESRARERQIVRDQLGLALRNLRPNALLMPALAAVICVMFHAWIATPRLVLWFVLVTVGCVPIGLISIRNGSFAAAPRRETHGPLFAAMAAYFAFALAWSSMGLLLWVPHNDLACLIVIMLLACTVAGNGALVGASRPLTLISYVSYGGALIATPLQNGGPVYDGLAVLAVIYLGYMLFMSRQIYLTARDMLLLRYEKSDLVDALARSKAESDRARENAEAASRAKSQFLANMSHELRTPLNAILGFSEMITSRVFAPDAPKHYEYAGLIHDSGRHLLTLINDILDLAKIEAGSWTLHETDLDLAAAIREACTMLKPRADLAGSALAADI